jgi:hypothetical protein
MKIDMSRNAETRIGARGMAPPPSRGLYRSRPDLVFAEDAERLITGMSALIF